jgi:quinol monooxygenase YgiN
MLVVFVHAKVHAHSVEAFRDATLENARASLKEPGVVRFDVIQQLDDATRFVLCEVYRDEAAPAAHKATQHYEKWRDTVAPMMAEPRTSAKYSALYPEPERWQTP